MRKKKRFLTGFTLIEFLVVTVVFSIAITASVSLLGSSLHYQKEILEEIYLLNTASFVSEYMSRAMRMAQKDIRGVCIASKHNFATFLGESGIKFLNYNNECQEFFLEDAALKVRKAGISQPLTPKNLSVENLRFRIVGQSQDDALQPKVTFALTIKTKTQRPRELKFQNSVSQRALDVPY